MFIAFEVREFVLGVLCIIIGGPVQLIGGTHLPRFEAIAYVLPHFDVRTYVVIRVSSAFIFQTFSEVFYLSL